MGLNKSPSEGHSHAFFGATYQIFPAWQDERILAVHHPPEATFDRNKDVLRLKSEDGEGEQALSEVQEPVEKDELEVDAAHAVHDKRPHAQRDA